MGALTLKGVSSGGAYIPPPPPYLQLATVSSEASSIGGLFYVQGAGPSASSELLQILAAGLIPATGTITVTPSANIEFSNNSGATWFSTAQNFAYSSGMVSTGLVYLVRLKAGLSPTSYNETLTISGQGGINVSPFVCAVSGVVTAATPVITLNGSPLSFLDTEVSYDSSQQSFTVSAVYLVADLVITPPTGFKISLTNGSGYSTSPINISPTGQTVSTTNIYVVFSPLAITSYSANISGTSTGASSVNCAVSGTGLFNTFKFIVKTNNAGSSSSTQFTLPLLSGQTYNAVIDWGDGSTTSQTTSTNPTHTYASAGTYQITIGGIFPVIRFNNTGDKLKLLSIDHWGDIVWGSSLAEMFFGCSNMVATYTDLPNWANVTSLKSAFENCSLFNGVLNGANVSNVTNMLSTFAGCLVFNKTLSSWNTGNVTNMSGMFSGCSAFNQSLNSWDVSKVTNMSSMFNACASLNQSFSNWVTTSLVTASVVFNGCTVFNGDISTWNMSSVTTINSMLRNCKAFNQSLNSWNTSNVTTMLAVFEGSNVFNGNITSWNTSKVTTMNAMFNGASAFNQNIGSWNVGLVADMNSMFGSCSAFNQSLNSWSVGSVTDMGNMFFGCSIFNSSIVSWDVSKVTSFNGMFNSASAFNQDISGWSTSAATSMGVMFNGASAFNQNIGGWNVSNVTNMNSMLRNATAFNQNIGSWNVSSVTTCSSFMQGKLAANYSASNLDAIYNNWSLLTLHPNLSIDFGSIKYTAAGVAGKAVLTSAPNSWTITDGGI